jgi:hypothetical protein
MNGTACQIELAEQIRPRVEAEFQRVAGALRSASLRQSETDRRDTLAVIAILEEKRDETLSNDRAGYFICNWQEMTDQVRKMIAADSRFEAIQAGRELRRHSDSGQDNL